MRDLIMNAVAKPAAASSVMNVAKPQPWLKFPSILRAIGLSGSWFWVAPELNGQTGKRADGQTGRRADGQTGSGQAGRRANGQAVTTVGAR